MKLKEFIDLYAGDDVLMNLLSEDGMEYDTVPLDSTYNYKKYINNRWLNGKVIYFDYHDDEFYVSVDLNGDDDYGTKVNSTMRIRRGRSVMASAWKAPNGRKYGKQTNRFPGKYLFTRKELRDMVDSGIAEDMAGTFDPMAMNYDIIGISWNETNGYRSGILIQDNDTGELYVGNTGDATRARL
jgi:hypothetical protein